MRLLLVLLALLTGLSLPEVSAASSRVEVAGTGLAGSASAAVGARRQECAVQACDVPRARFVLSSAAVWAPVAMPRAIGTVCLSDCPRE